MPLDWHCPNGKTPHFGDEVHRESCLVEGLAQWGVRRGSRSHECQLEGPQQVARLVARAHMGERLKVGKATERHQLCLWEPSRRSGSEHGAGEISGQAYALVELGWEAGRSGSVEAPPGSNPHSLADLWVAGFAGDVRRLETLTPSARCCASGLAAARLNRPVG